MARILVLQRLPAAATLRLLLLLVVVLASRRNGSSVLAQSPASVRTIVSDLAGMLYPMQSQHSVEFGTSTTATLLSLLDDEFIPEDDAGGDTRSNSDDRVALRTATCAAKLCVDFVFTSEFAADPFLLARYVSKLPVVSSLAAHDSGAHGGSSAIQPVITGTNPRSSSNNTTRAQTRWRFATSTTNNSSAASDAAVDVLLHLKQQSQFRALKDQLLLHVTVQLGIVTTTAVESLSLYSNARVTYTTTRVDAQRVQIAIAITRSNSSSADVAIDDAYPLAAAVDAYPLAAAVDASRQSAESSRWVYTSQSECAPCAQQLYSCTSRSAFESGACNYDTTTSPLVVCLRDHFDDTSAWITSELAQRRIGTDLPLQSMLAFCFDTLLRSDNATASNGTDAAAALATRDWWRAADALSCLARRNCPIGPSNGALSVSAASAPHSLPSTMLVLTNATAYDHALRIRAATFAGSLTVTFATTNDTTNGTSAYLTTPVPLDETTIANDLAAALEAVIPITSAAVSLTKTWDGDAWVLTIAIRHVVFPNLKVQFTLDGASSTTASDVSETYAMSAFSSVRVVAYNAAQLTLATASCDACTHNLATCQQNDACRERVLPCIIARLESVLHTAAVTLVPQFGTRRVAVLAALSACTANTSIATWRPVRTTLLCLAKQQCAIGMDPATDERTVFQVASGTQTFIVTPENSATSNNVVALTFRRPNALLAADETCAFKSTVANLPLFVRTFVLENAGDVTVSSRIDPDDPTKLRITITYANLLSALPAITGGIEWLEDTPPSAYLECVDDTHLSLSILLPQLQASALALRSVGAPSNHTWMLSHQCRICSAQLFACDAAFVANRTCHYASMATPFGRCLRTQLPVRAFNELLAADNSSNATTSSTHRVVRNELAHCAQHALHPASSSNNVPAATAASINAALGCFAAHKCPFGPLDSVHAADNNSSSSSTHGSVVLLEASSYIHLLRIPSRAFRFTLRYRFGDSDSPQASATAAIDSSMPRTTVLSRLVSALRASGVVPSLRAFDVEAGGEEWMIECRYDNVVLPSFTISIDDTVDAAPAVRAIAHVLMKGTPRLAVAPRDPHTLFVQPADNAVNADTDTCQTCVRSKLEACRRSRYCHTTVLPCLVTRLEAASTSAATSVDVGNWLLACATTSAANTSTLAVASSVGFYHWYAPLSRFLACYALANCRVSRRSTVSVLSDDAGTITIDDIDTAPTVLRIQPGHETLRLPLVDVDAKTFALGVAAPLSGSNFDTQQHFAFVGNSTDLAQLLTYMTMDTARNVTVDVRAVQSNDSAVVQVTYGDDYVGLLPRLSIPTTGTTAAASTTNASTAGGSTDGASQPRLFFTSSLSSPSARDVPQLDWSNLLVVLRNASSSMLPSPSSTLPLQSCDTCEQQFLTECRASTICSGQVLICLLFALSDQLRGADDSSTTTTGAPGTVGLLPLGTDKDLLPALLACVNAHPPADWRPVQSFLDCYEHTQCPVSAATPITATGASSGAPSYTRLQRGSIVYSLPAPVNATDAAAFDESLNDVRALLEPMATSTGATIDVLTWQHLTSTASSLPLQDDVMQHVEIAFSGYYGLLPMLPLPNVTYVQPRLVLFTQSSASLPPPQPSVTQLTSTLSRYIYRAECTSVCSANLTACSSGDSRASLVCREVVLPCLTAQLSSATTSTTDLAAMVRTCTAGSILGSAASITDFVACYHASQCPLTVQDVHNTPTFLQLVPGRETLEVPLDGETLLTIHHPSDGSAAQSASSNQFTLATDALVLQEFIQTNVFSTQRASVRAVLTAGTSANTRTLELTYGGGYLGDLPVITGIDVQSLARALPQARSIYPIALLAPLPQRYDLIAAQLVKQVAQTAATRASCSNCAALHLQGTSCSACADVLECLTTALQSPSATDVVPTQSGTGADFSPVLQTCVASLGTAQWVGLGGFFACLMEHACPVSASPLSTPDSTTFALVQDAVYTFEIEPSELASLVELTPPTELGALRVDVSIDPTDGYAQLLQAMHQMFAEGGVEATALIALTETASKSSPTASVVTLAYHGYYDALPVLQPTSGLVETGNQRAQFTFQALGATPSWEAVYALIDPPVASVPAGATPAPNAASPVPNAATPQPNAATPQPNAATPQPNAATPGPGPAPVRVLAGNCVECGAALFGCSRDAIDDGSCSYEQPTSAFAQCLAREVTASKFSTLVAQQPGPADETSEYLSTCHNEIRAVDEAANAVSFIDDQWYKASDALAMWGLNRCPLGPLAAAVTNDVMVQLEEAMLELQFTTASGVTFTDAVFTATYGFRTVTTSAFSDSTTESDLQAIVASILPSHAVVASVTTALRANSSGYDITLAIARLYFPAVSFELRVGTDTQPAPNVRTPWTARFIVDSVDTSMFTTLSP